MVSVACAVPPAVTVTGLVEPKLSVGGSCAPCGLDAIDADSVTLPVKPFVPPTVMASAPLAPGLTVTVAAAGDSEIPGGAPTVSAIVVDSVRLPEVPAIVTVAAPVAAVLLAVSVRTLDAVAGFVAKLAVTPAGRPVVESVTLPENPFAPTTSMVSVALAPSVTERVPAVGESVKLGAAVTITETVVEPVKLPDVPVIVTVEVPGAAVLLAVSVNTLDAVAGLVAKLAVTPLGRPVAASVTLPVKPFAPVTSTVSVALAPCTTETAAEVAPSVNVGAGVTVNATVVEAVKPPEVPVTVTIAAPSVAVPLAVNVSTLELVAGFVLKLAATPAGSPVAVSVTLPAKPFAPVTSMVSVAIAPCTTETAAAVGASVKLGGGFTVSAIVVEAVRLPEVPVTVTVAMPVVAVLDAVNVSTLEPVAGLVPKLAATPLGKPVAVSVTLPVKPFAPVILTVSVALAPCTTETAAAVGASVKLGAAATVSAIVVEAVRLPEVPEIVTVDVPVVAVLDAVKVMPLAPVAGLVPKLAVTPVGSPVAAKVTLPLKPFAGVTVTASVAVLPWTTETVLLVATSV